MSETPRDSRGESWRTLCRRAGCIAGCLIQPLVTLILVAGSLIGGYWLGRKTQREAVSSSGGETPPSGEDEDQDD